MAALAAWALPAPPRKCAVMAVATLLLFGSGVGAGWWLAGAARARTLAALQQEQAVSAQLRADVALQNTAVQRLAAQTRAAEQRRLVAQQRAVASGRRADAALARLQDVQAVSCHDAMPAVRQLLREVK